MAAALLTAIGCRHKQVAVEATPQFTPAKSDRQATADLMMNTAAQFGVPIYPGSTPDTGHFSVPAAGQPTNRAYLMYASADPMEKVIEYYKTALNMLATQFGSTTQLKGTSSSGAEITINVGRDMQNSQTNFTITAFMRPVDDAGTQMAAAAPTSAMPPRTYATPPATANRDAAQDYNYPNNNTGTDNGTVGGSPSYPDQAPPTDNSGNTDDGSSTDAPPGQNDNGDQGQNDNPPGDPPL